MAKVKKEVTVKKTSLRLVHADDVKKYEEAGWVKTGNKVKRLVEISKVYEEKSTIEVEVKDKEEKPLNEKKSK